VISSNSHIGKSLIMTIIFGGWYGCSKFT
jgi:hypothetical protein